MSDGLTIPEMQADVYANNLVHGWYDADRTIGDEISLLHSEISEAFEAWRDYGLAHVTKAPEDGEQLGKPLDFQSELADVFIRLLDTCQRHDVDLQFEFKRKMNYNRTRPYLHGGKRV